MDCLDTLGTVAGAAIVLAIAAASLFSFGSKIGVWFSGLETENRSAYLAAIALGGWTLALALVAWGISFLAYVVYIGEQPATPTAWAGAVSVALLLAAPVVALLAGITWLAMVVAVRVLRWGRRGSTGHQGDGG